MKMLLRVVTLFFLLAPFAATNAQTILTLKKSAIVILVPPEKELKSQAKEEGFADFSGDFAYYAGKMKSALEKGSKIPVQWSTASQVAFPDTTIKPIIRSKLETGWGYVFYRPGEQPVIVEGVADDEQLVCIAAKLYKIKVGDYECGA